MASVKYSDLKAGDRIEYIGDVCKCLNVGQVYTVHENDDGGLFVNCEAGYHYLDIMVFGNEEEIPEFRKVG